MADGVPILLFEAPIADEVTRTIEIKLADWASALKIESVILDSVCCIIFIICRYLDLI